MPRWKNSEYTNSDLMAEGSGLELHARKNNGGRWGAVLDVQSWGECAPGEEKASAIKAARNMVERLVKFLGGTVTWKSY